MVYRSADDEGASTLKGYMPDLAARDCERRFDSGGRRLDITLSEHPHGLDDSLFRATIALIIAC
jgi:hypothetical protein